MNGTSNRLVTLAASAIGRANRKRALRRIQKRNEAQRNLTRLGRTAAEQLLPCGCRCGNVCISGASQEARNRLLVQSVLQSASEGLPAVVLHEGNRPLEAALSRACAHFPYFRIINSRSPFYEPVLRLRDEEAAMMIAAASDAGSRIKGTIYEFLDSSQKVVAVVDCENSDPYKLCAALRGLDGESTSKIARILLFDDVHTASAWRILESFTKIPVEHILIERVKQSKSLVDIKLTARACQEHYQNQVDSFIIVSSDSDYWGLISSLPDARFLVMIEREKCGPDMKNALMESGIFYCYIDDFYSGNSDDIKTGVLFKEMYRYLDQSIHLNVNDMFEEALRAARLTMPPDEKRQFYDRHIRQMRLVIDKEGNVSIELKK